jgi:thiol:disulfide interchange protein
MSPQVKFDKKFPKLLNLFLVIYLISGFFVSITHPAYAQESKKTYNELPDAYKKAFKVTAFLKDNHSFEVNLETFNGYSIYKETFEIKSSFLNLRLKKASPSFQGLDPLTQKIKEFYKDQNTFLYEISDKKNPPLTEVNLKLQACSKENCLLPITFTLPIINPQKNANPTAPSLDSSESSYQENLAKKFKSIFQNSSSLLSFPSLFILFLAGLITSFSPCVLPLFPITLGIFSRWSHHDQSKAFALSLSYGLGIILCYAAHGLLSAATGGVFGSLTQSPTYLLTIGSILFLSGFVYSGLIPFPFANKLIEIAQKVEGPLDLRKKTSFNKLLFKGFLMGATLGLVASPCVGPILLSLLALLSRQLPEGNLQSYASGFFALSIFGLGMAIPFLILGHFYFRLHKRIQLGKFSLVAKYLGSAMLTGASFYFLIPGSKILFSKKDISTFQKYTWENKPNQSWLIIDFRADWCTACLEIEKEVFMDPQLQEFLKKNSWSIVQVDMTQADQNKDLASRFKVLSLPTLIFVSPENKTCEKHTLNEKESVEKFIRRLERAKNDCS